MLLAGLGIGALASQLGSVTVSSVPDEQSGEVGGLQNTVTNLGASIGTALSGAVLIAALTTSLIGGIQKNPAVPSDGESPEHRPNLPAAFPSCPTKTCSEALSKADVPNADCRRDRQGERGRPDRRAALLALGRRDHRSDRAVHDAVHPDPAARKARRPKTRARRWERSEKFNQPFDHQQTAEHAKRGHGDATPVMPDRSLGPVDRVLRPIGSDCEAE